MTEKKNNAHDGDYVISADGLPLDTARAAFAWLATGPDPVAIDGRPFVGLPDRLIPVDEVRDRLLDTRCPRATRDAVWRHLVDRARRDGATWMVVCVGMALPGLAGSGRWLGERFRGDRADVHGAVLAGFIEAISTIDLDRPGLPSRLQWAARRAGQRALEESLDAPVPSQSVFESRAPQRPYGHPDLVLARAVRDGVLTPTEADLISSTRLGDESVTDWAESHDRSVHATAKARSRAERRLAAYLTTPENAAASGDDPVAEAALAAVATTVAAGFTPTEAGDDASLAVSGRRRNGRPARGPGLSRSVSKTTSGSGLLSRGESTPTTSGPATSEQISEVRRCA